jgi:ATP-dependent DNA ligase
MRPMLGRLVRELPIGAYLYEPKWDGFRCLAFRSGGDVDLRSRHDRPFARYFPEVVAGLLALDAEAVGLDGEIVASDFAQLMARLHPQLHPLDWVPLRLERVAEVAYTQVDAGRFRHPAKFRRWRPDRDPDSCRLEQLA